MKLIIDRFEGNFAVCEMENKEIIDIERSRIPKEAKEGDILVINSDKIYISYEETEKRRSEIERLANELWK